MSSPQKQLCAWALALAEQGWPVFPLRPGGKRPAIARWDSRATTDQQRVTRCWSAGAYNIAVATGPAGLVVVDCDVPTDDQTPPEGWNMLGINTGADALDHLARRSHHPLPDTYTVRTPSGGVHYYFRAPGGERVANSAGLLGWLVDIRAVGGYVVAPGSRVPNGAYELLDDAAPAALPGWILRALADKAAQRHSERPHAATAGAECAPRCRSAYARAALRREQQRVAHAPSGQQNHTLYIASVALGRLVAGGALDPASARAALHEAMSRLPNTDPQRPWRPRDIDRTVTSGFRAGARTPRHLTNRTDQEGRAA